jgi:hypothetical protein
MGPTDLLGFPLVVVKVAAEAAELVGQVVNLLFVMLAEHFPLEQLQEALGESLEQ